MSVSSLGYKSDPAFEQESEGSMQLLSAEEVEQVNEKMTSAWEYFKDEWWKIHKDEDETDAKEIKAARKREPVGKKEYCVFVASVLASLGIQVIFRDEPIMKGAAGSTINFLKIFYIQIPQGTAAKHVMRAIAIATFVAGVTFHYVPEDPHGIIRMLRAAPLTDMFMAIILKCDVATAGLDTMLNRVVKKCTNAELPNRLAKAITKGFLAVVTGGLMNIPQYTGPYIAAGAAVLAKANIRGVIDTIYQTVEDIESSIKQKAAIAAILGTCTALTAASAYTLTIETVRQSAWNWALAATLVVAGDTLGRTLKNTIKAIGVPKEIIKDEIKRGIRPQEPPTPFWKKCLTVANGIGLVGVTLGIAYVTGPSTLSTSASSAVTTNSGILTTICQEMGSLLKIASSKLVPESVALFGSLGFLAIGSGYHLYETVAGVTDRLSPVVRSTAAAFLAAVQNVVSYELKDHLRGATKANYKKKKKKDAVEIEMEVLVH